MAEKIENQYQPQELSNGHHRTDEESLLTMEEEEAKRKKKMKWTIGIIAFVIFQVVQALFFILVIMKFKSPKFRIANEFDIQSLTAGTQASPSFDMTFVAPFRVKNTNWGPFKYGASNVTFTYGGVEVGQAIIPKSKANFKSTKKINVDVTVNTNNLPSDVSSTLANELGSNVITLKSQGELKGKITVMFMFKKTKISQMNCTMEIDTLSKALKSMSCN